MGASLEGIMKPLFFLALMGLFSCAHHRPLSLVDGQPMAQDTMAAGKVLARATKKMEKQVVCFYITLVMRNAAPEHLAPRNWGLAWVDQKNQYHLLSLNQRDPASIPIKSPSSDVHFEPSDEWTNTFRACASRTQLKNVKGLVLTPKELPYDDTRSLRMEW
jgi:hypothetical protein